MRPSRPTLAILALVPLLIAGKNRESTSYLGFHLEAEVGDKPSKTRRVIIGTNTFRVRSTPEFTQADVVGFYPFRNEGSTTYGVAFKLNARAAKKLEAVTADARGRKIYTVISATPVDFVVIDDAIKDGYIVCWKGLNDKHLAQFKAAGFEQITPAGGAGGGAGRAVTPRPPADDFAPLPAGRGEPSLPSR